MNLLIDPALEPLVQADGIKPSPVMVLDELAIDDVQALLGRFGLELSLVPARQEIPGSYWGESEAGLIGDELYARLDTPIHSILHEASHYVCMDGERRAALHRDAGGEFDEEDAVCYLQILLAAYLVGYDRAQVLNDMDVWGYTFRLGSAAAWFRQDAEDAKHWLQRAGVIREDEQLTWCVRT